MPVTMNGFSNPAFRREHNNAPEGHNQTTSIAGGRDFGQITAVKAQYTDVSFRTKKRGIEGFISLQPTEESLIYKLKISAQIDSTIVNIFPIEPHIGREVNGQAIPHMYPDGSLCLYYPDYKEWKYSDLWADTLIPWTSLWLYYYELWLQTGEWLGGGIHSRKEKSDVTQ